MFHFQWSFFILPLFAFHANGWTVIQPSQDASPKIGQPKQTYNPFTTPNPVGPSTKSRPFYYSPSATPKPPSQNTSPNSVYVTRKPFNYKSVVLPQSRSSTPRSVIPTWKAFSPLPTPKSVAGSQGAYPKSVIPTWKSPNPPQDTLSKNAFPRRKAYTRSSDGSYVQSDESQYKHNADGRRFLHNYPDLGLFGWSKNARRQADGTYHEGGSYLHHDGGRYIHDDSGKYIHVDNKYIHDDPGYDHVIGPNGKDWEAPLEPQESIRVPEVIYKPGGKQSFLTSIRGFRVSSM